MLATRPRRFYLFCFCVPEASGSVQLSHCINQLFWGEYMKITEKLARMTCLTACLVVPTVCLAESGTYEQVWSLLANYTKSERGSETVTGGSSSGTATIVKSSGGLFTEGASDVAECILFAKKSAAGLDLEAPCSTTSPAGDKIFSVAIRKIGDVTPGSTGTGKSHIAGGTGKFSGITGDCTYKVENLPPNHIVSMVKCEWQKP
jgi:hypothetical protein